MKIAFPNQRVKPRGFTLLEVVISFGIGAIMIGAIIRGYSLSARRAEWSSYSLAAQTMAIKGLERAVAAPWRQGGVDKLTAEFFEPVSEFLCLPTQQTNLLTATNFTTIVEISTTPPLRMVRVDCLWTFMGRSLHSNSVATIRGPNL